MVMRVDSGRLAFGCLLQLWESTAMTVRLSSENDHCSLLTASEILALLLGDKVNDRQMIKLALKELVVRHHLRIVAIEKHQILWRRRFTYYFVQGSAME